MQGADAVQEQTPMSYSTDGEARVRLRWLDPLTNETRSPLLKTPITLGREYSHMPSDLNDRRASRVVFEDNEVSRYHALIDWADGQVLLQDQKSVNGTIVNGQTITSIAIKTGDTLSIGPYILDVVIEATPQPPMALDETSLALDKEESGYDSTEVGGGSTNFIPAPEFQPETDDSLLKQISDARSNTSARAIAERYYKEIMNEARLEVIDELMSPDFLFTIPTHPEPYRGPDGFKQLVTMLHTAFPDVHLDVQHLLVDGETVVGHWIGSGTHTGGPLHTVKGDIPPSGKHFVIDGVSWLKIVNGKVVESLANEDTLSLLRQIGVLPPPDSTSSSEISKSLAVSFFNDILNRGQLDTIGEIISPDFVMHLPLYSRPLRGPEALKNFVKSFHSAFPDTHYSIQLNMSDSDMAAIRWIFTGTHQDEFLSIPASGKSVHLQGVSIFQINEGQISEIWVNENDLGLLEQIGFLGGA
jgi:steroid delta-isomerase-like uncharacterized protein